MKILILVHKYPLPPKDGGSIAVLNLANGLAQNNVKVTILAMSTEKHPFIKNQNHLLNKNVELFYKKIKTKISLFGLVFNFVFSKTPYTASRFISEKYLKTLIELINSKQFDVIQCESLYTTSYIESIKKNTNALISYRSHNIEHQIWKRNKAETRSFIKKIYLKNLIKRIKNLETKVINKYDVLIPITNLNAKYYTNNGNNKPQLVLPAGFQIPNHITDTKFSNDIFFLGSLDWLPNISGLKWFLTNIYKKINNHTHVNLNIAGRNASVNTIKMIKAFNVNYLGEIKDTTEFIKNNSIMIVPLFSGSGMRVKIIESIVNKRLVISTSLGAEGLGLTHNKNIIIADKASDFIDAINFIINNKDKYMEIVSNAFDYISENFDTFVLSRKLKSFYQDEINKCKQL